MSDPITSAGGAPEPSNYAALAMDAQFTGIWTQRNPLRDADVPYLERQYYQATRFDSILDGINREISPGLTDKRRAGSVVYNSNTFPPISSYFSWKYVQNNTPIIRVLADSQHTPGGVLTTDIYDATAGQKSTLFEQTGQTGRTRFLSVNTELFFCNALANKKVLEGKNSWGAAQLFTVGDFIVDSNGNIQSFQAQQTVLSITTTELRSATMGTSTQKFLILTLSADAPTIPALQTVTLAGLTTHTALNGQVFTYQNIAQGWNLDLGTDQIAFASSLGTWAPTADTGTATTFTQFDSDGNSLTGTTGSTQPTWPTTPPLQRTQDGTVTWTFYGSQVQDWGVAAPTAAPTIVPGPSVRRWSKKLDLSALTAKTFAILDANSITQVLTTPGITGNNPPSWNTSLGGVTKDGSAVWTNYGQPVSWLANNGYQQQYIVLVDPNGNLQIATGTPPGPIQRLFVAASGSGYAIGDQFNVLGYGTGGTGTVTGVSGSSVSSVVVGSGGLNYISVGVASTTPITGAGSGLEVQIQAGSTTSNVQPTWNTTLGGNTVDNLYNWFNAGPGIELAAGTQGWAFSYHSIDGTLTTASPVVYGLYGVLGAAGGLETIVTVMGSDNPQVDQIWLGRTAQGQATLVFVDAIPNPGTATPVIYNDVIPDTTTTGQQALNPLIPLPIAKQGDPPPAGMTAPAYHLNRIWTIVGNIVQYSAGPDSVSGNGNTAWPPLNTIPFPCQPIKLRPVTVSNGGLLVYTNAGTYIILGTGTANNPFYTTIYESSVSLAGYDSEDVHGATSYFMESNQKVACFDPSNGYVEIGFPIGDQFQSVTTGGTDGPMGALYNPATTYVTWNLQSSGQTRMYVADGSVGWFSFAPISPPESGNIWNPRAVILGGTSAVQSVETSPGMFDLLIGPSGSGGPILKRDTSGTVWTDLVASTATPYPAWDVKGVITLCQTGQVAEVAHVALKSRAMGARPVVSILMGEIAPTTETPWDVLDITGNDPPDLEPSTSMYSDRYVALQNGVCPKSDCVSLKVDYGAQAFGDELLKFGIYGAKHEERKQQ